MTPDAMDVIQVENLHKIYRVRQSSTSRFSALRNLLFPKTTEIHAVNGVSFTIRNGEAVGYLGPNGAGKSTTIKILTGILVPTQGSVRVGGLVPWRQRHENARQIGVVFGQRTQLYWDLPLMGQIGLLVFRTDSTQEIREKVREGTIAIDLTRPANFLLSLLANGCAPR